MKVKTLWALVSVSTLLTFGNSTANATTDLEVSWWINGDLVDAFTISGSDVGNGFLNYTGSQVFENPLTPLEVVNFSFNLNGKPGASAGLSPNVLVSGNMAIENLFSSEIDVRLLVELPTKTSWSTTSLAGSVAVGLTANADGGTLASLPSVPFWQARMDGSTVGPEASLFFDPFVLHQTVPGSQSTSGNFGIPNPVDGPSMLSSIGFEVNYSLTSNDLASVTSVFNVIPGPSGLLTLAVAGLMVRKRRRE